ncbi:MULTISPECIES: MBL fold metallo-hydrolase [Clostridium]|jgi:7,8-dihydropterin-6-yl-methyl-4-(beta-D-ribofuranosyl)aminobenzene 5'-phosphate synthase|uniref:MBL fold metallo-hydrolase n=1 Tax=Clostridium TaxID=1485 RepID=UPI001FAB5B7F|nr:MULTISPECIES: MBL fold metallo-hydrolase [Clostridium]MDB1944804.1 MBL fold metallo-hydrolase [Clostridium tertium]MDB1952015.1 MBL fold metallo-hydrolase [Clostridium tertium]MDB1968908.1 MBL fold metallo-hydrolase [Clostridium tertium]MDU1277534.1 MBL fold metallo-hydrolase [Clostridium sp.]MDU1567260.1 MBL fold metallo-hydrolase [Clostridium sp.]
MEMVGDVMVITTLVENTSLLKEFKCKHGLSLHIKTNKHNILFDLGSNGLFIENAIKLNIDISDVDILVISHGHKDHGGALKLFLQHNSKAKIYINKDAFNKYYTSVLGALKFYVGLDDRLQFNERIIFTEDIFQIDEDICLFSNVPKKYETSNLNDSLFIKIDGKYYKDDFTHEQSLLIRENDKYILIAGCAHKGIVNIIDKAEEIMDSNLSTVIGGFHLFNPVNKKSESLEFISNIAKNLNNKNTIFYTCHCTGNKAFNILKENLKDKIMYLSTGQVIEL